MAVGAGVNTGVSAVVGVGNAVVAVEDGDITVAVAGIGGAVGRTVANVGVSDIFVAVAIGSTGVGVSVGGIAGWRRLPWH